MIGLAIFAVMWYALITFWIYCNLDELLVPLKFDLKILICAILWPIVIPLIVIIALIAGDDFL